MFFSFSNKLKIVPARVRKIIKLFIIGFPNLLGILILLLLFIPILTASGVCTW